MTEPPTAVLSDRLRDAIAGRTVRAALFTTFSFEPAFFEQEILSVLFDLPLHHAPKVRQLQLETALRPLTGKVAVYYDPRALSEGDLGSPGLDVRRIPCRLDTGLFHPKVTLVAVDHEDTQSLVIAVASANLTRAGWWENIEAGWVSELHRDQASPIGIGVTQFLGDLRTPDSGGR